jgi:hypothetical protein
MKAWVVYESMWGNTEKVAQAVARGLVARGLGGARVAEVHDVSAADVAGADLLVLGGPTHAFSMSRVSTRTDAVRQGASPGGEDTGMREWLEELPRTFPIPVATFDTRVGKVRNLPGSAAKSASKDLARHHHARVVSRQSFYVDDTPGPLSAGELDRAEAWGAELAGSVQGG